MALIIGGGISIGGNISVAGVTPNSITVATINDGSADYYGAYNYTSGHINFGISNFGTVTSDYLYTVMYKSDISLSISETYIALNDGTYSGFTVTNGVIDSDLPTYPRVFTIGGSNYTFNLAAQGYYFASGDVLSLASNVGATVTTVYNPGIQPSLTPNSIIVGQKTSGPSTYYGADKAISPSYGTIVSDYLEMITYNSPTTNIILVPGTYTGFTVDSNKAIDGDSTTARTFTVNGIDAVFTVSGSAPNYSYLNMGDPFSLQTSVGSTLTAVYDPAAQPVPGPGEFVSGNMTVGTDGVQYGWQPLFIGSATISGPPTGPTYQITYASGAGTNIVFVSGTYGTTVVDGTAATIDGENSITVTIDGVTEIGTLVTNNSGPPGCKLTFATDVFSLQSKNNQTLAVTMVAGAATPGEVASGSITVGTDGIAIYGYFPPGMLGSSTITPANMVSRLYWSGMGDPTGTTLIRLDSGTYGSVVVDGSLGTVDAETQLTVVVDGISQTGTLNAGGSYVQLNITGDPYSFQSKNGQTLTVSVVAGAGGGGATTYSVNTDYSSSPAGISFQDNFDGTYQVTLNQPFWTNAAGYTALGALTMGGTFIVTMPLGGSSPRTITLSSSWSGGSMKTTTVTSSTPLTLGGGPSSVPDTVTV